MTKSHLYIPDVQTKPRAPNKHLRWIGKYIADKQPDRIIIGGDFADMPSLSSYDKGRKAAEGTRYQHDVDSCRRALDLLFDAISSARNYSPIIDLTLGNHEERILRHAEANPELDGKLSISDLGYEDYGITVHDFLKVIVRDGIAYSHFFPRAGSGKVTQTRNGAPNAKAQLIREGRSCTAGHTQGLDIACMPLGGKLQWSIIAGSCYLHEERYLSPQGNKHWNGVILKNGVSNGNYSPIFVDLNYLARRYGR